MKTQSHTELPDLRFDPEKHHYFLGKKRIPGVSEILQKLKLSKDYSEVDNFYAERGKACHKAIELHLKGVLDPSSLDDAIKAQFGAFLAYWNEVHDDEKILALEKPMTELNGVFAGTPDLITEKAIYDWKASKSHDRVADLQGQFYKQLAYDNLGITLNFIVVELRDDGSFKEFQYGIDKKELEHVLGLWGWKQR